MSRRCPICGTDHNNHSCSCDIEAKMAALRQSHAELLVAATTLMRLFRIANTGKGIGRVGWGRADKALEAIAKAEALQGEK